LLGEAGNFEAGHTYLVDVIAGGPGFVAVGQTNRGIGLWTSVDGVEWERLQDGGGVHAAFWLSTDGRNWRRVPAGPELAFREVRTPLGGWSPDGPWGRMSWLTTDEDELIAEGVLRCNECRTPSAANRTSGTGRSSGGLRWSGLASSEDRPDRDRIVWRSRDGLHWSRSTHNYEGDRDPPEFIGGLVGWMRGGPVTDVVEISADGQQWRQAYRSSDGLMDMAHGADGFLAIGYGTPTTPDGESSIVVATSPDGTDWTEWSDPGGLANSRIVAVAMGDDRAVAVGGGEGELVAFITPALADPPRRLPQANEPEGGLASVGGTWEHEADLIRPVRGATAVSLSDGTIAILGGRTFDGLSRVALRFDPQDGTSTRMPPLEWARSAPGAVSLSDDTILAFGGDLHGGRRALGRSVEAFDPQTQRWSRRRPMPVGRRHGTTRAVVGPGGLVYVGGGAFGWGNHHLDIYDPRRDRWLRSIPLPVGATSLDLVFNGENLLALTPARIWRWAAGERVWHPGPALLRGGYDARAVGLPDGRLVLLRPLVVARPGRSEADVRTLVEVFDPATGVWSDGPSMTARFDFAYTTLSDGRVLLFGGSAVRPPEPDEDFPDEPVAPCELGRSVGGLRDVRSLTLEPATE
jgi:hypothetical protein